MTLNQQNAIGACISMTVIALIVLSFFANWDSRGQSQQDCPATSAEYADGPRFEIGNPTCLDRQ